MNEHVARCGVWGLLAEVEAEGFAVGHVREKMASATEAAHPGLVTERAKAAVMAASTTLPPSLRTATAALVASVSAVATMARRLWTGRAPQRS